MNYILNIKDFTAELLDFNDEILYSNIPVNTCEKHINETLDKYSNICKYYINCNNSLWSVSFKVGIDQIEEMVQTTFEIKLFKNIKNGNGIIILTNEIGEHEQWRDLHKDFIKNFNKN